MAGSLPSDEQQIYVYDGFDIDLIEERRRSGSFFTTSRRTWFTSDAIVLACRA